MGRLYSTSAPIHTAPSWGLGVFRIDSRLRGNDVMGCGNDVMGCGNGVMGCGNDVMGCGNDVVDVGMT